MSSETRWRGRCQCGEVTFEVEAKSAEATLCYCNSCRAACGAHVLAWCTFERASLRLLSGQLATYLSSPGVERGFCGRCGTTLTYARDDLPDEIDVTVCCLDRADELAPIQHIWLDDRLAWVNVSDDLPKYPGWSERHV